MHPGVELSFSRCKTNFSYIYEDVEVHRTNPSRQFPPKPTRSMLIPLLVNPTTLYNLWIRPCSVLFHFGCIGIDLGAVRCRRGIKL
jgi:hypothetical protein